MRRLITVEHADATHCTFNAIHGITVQDSFQKVSVAKASSSESDGIIMHEMISNNIGDALFSKRR